MNKKRNLPSALASLYDTPSFRLFRELDNSPALRAVRDLQRSGMFDELTRVSNSQRKLIETLNSSRWLQMHDEMGALSKVISNSAALSAATSINSDLTKYFSHIRTPVFPEIDRVTKIIRAISESYRPFQTDAFAWTTRIQSQIELLNQPWALSGAEAISISGFAKISWLSSRAQSNAPFDRETVSLFQDQLFDPQKIVDNEADQKDDAAVDAGLNPELIAVYPSEYSHVLSTAGFSFSFSQVIVPTSEGIVNSGEAYHPMHDALLKQVEILLRQLIDQQLRSLSGNTWIKQRVPGGMRKKWEETRQEEHENTGKQFDLIHYAGFMDLTDLICQKNNWKEAFCEFFVSPEDFRVSMTRLHPIRKSLAHARPLARCEVLVLVSEASRLLTVLRKVFPFS